jgi:DNA-binding Lrp family transcriptional regulator
MEDSEGRLELTDLERRVLAVLSDGSQPLDTVAIASAAKLRVGETLKLLRGLRERGLIEPRPPEDIRERFEVDEDALQRAVG